MLTIDISMRGTAEYSCSVIPGPSSDQTQQQFESSYEERWRDEDRYDSDFLLGTCSYFDDGFDVIDVFLGDEEDKKEILHKRDWTAFDFSETACETFDFAKSPENADVVGVWWYHDIKFNNVYCWGGVADCHPKKLKVSYGTDSKGYEALDGEPLPVRTMKTIEISSDVYPDLPKFCTILNDHFVSICRDTGALPNQEEWMEMVADVIEIGPK